MEWKQKNKGVLPKSGFPKLLKRLLDEVGVNAANNVKSEFRTCGIVPCNRDSVLKIIPKLTEEQIAEQERQVDIDQRWSLTFVNFMQQSTAVENKQAVRRGEKIDVAPGKGIMSRDINRTVKKSS